MSLSLNVISVCPFIRLEFDLFSSATISDRRKKNWLEYVTSVLYSSIRCERRDGGRRRGKQHLPFSFSSFSLYRTTSPLCCQYHAISVLLCCTNVYSRFNCPFLIYSLCLSISHQYAHWEVEKKEIRLNRQTSVCVCIYESYGQHLIQFDEW